MSYSSGAITSATPASALIAAMDAVITSTAGLTKVSSGIVSGANTWNVYKSDGASNAQGADFFFALGYITATPTAVLMTVFEGWNAGTALASNYAPRSTQIPVSGTWANPQAAAALPSIGTTMAYLQMQQPLITSGFGYALSITPDRLIFEVQSATNAMGYYLGLYDSFMSAADDPFPLCCLPVGLGSGASGNAMTTAATGLFGLATREPKQTASLAANFGVGASFFQGSVWTLMPTGSIVETYTQNSMLSRLLLQGRAGNAYRGLLKDILVGPPQSQNGDTITFALDSLNYTATRAGAGTQYGIYFLQV